MSTAAGVARARELGTVAFLAMVNGLQLVVLALVVATLMDVAIPGTMREAARVMVLDAPGQLVATAALLALACIAFRMTSSIMIALVAPELWRDGGWAGWWARTTPRLGALVLAVATGLPLIILSLWDVLGSSRQLDLAASVAHGGVSTAVLAALAGTAFLIIGVLVAAFPGDPLLFALSPRTGLAKHALTAVLGVFPWTLMAGVSMLILVSMTVRSWTAIGAFDRVIRGVIFPIVPDLACFFGVLAVAAIAGMTALRLASPMVPDSVARLAPLTAVTALGLWVSFAIMQSHWSPWADLTFDWWAGFWQLAIASLFLLVCVGLAVAELLAMRSGKGRLFGLAGRFADITRSAISRLDDLDGRWMITFLTLFATLAVFSLAFFNVQSVWLPQRLGPIALVLGWAAAILVLAFPFTFLAQATRVPYFAGMLIAALAFSAFDLNDNHTLRYIDGTLNGVRKSDPASKVPNRFNTSLDFEQWLTSRPDLDAYDHYPVFVIATEGGGLRAAYVAATVLGAIQDTCPAFAQHVFAISSVSGGSVGAAAFGAAAADLAAQQNGQAPPDAPATFRPCYLNGAAPDVFRTRMRGVTGADLLSPLLAGLLFPDALQRILPVPINQFDRARGIEHALEDAWAKGCEGCRADRMAAPLGELFTSEKTGAMVPHLIFNATEVGTGTATVASTAYVNLFQGFETGGSGGEVNQLRGPFEPDHELALSTAALLSARFPYLTPAARLTNGQYDSRFVDGGYFENSGAFIVDGLVKQMLNEKLHYSGPKNRPDVRNALRKAQIIALVIRSTPGCLNAADRQGCMASTTRAGGFGEIISPPLALRQAGSARAAYSKAELANAIALAKEFCIAVGQEVRPAPASELEQDCIAGEGYTAGFIRYPASVVELGLDTYEDVEVPLTWLLSSHTRALIDEAVDGVAKTDLASQMPKGGLPSISRVETAAKTGRAVIRGPVEAILCALATPKGAPAYGPDDVCDHIPDY